MGVFEKLSAINVNEHTEKKGNLTYLSWAWAWAEIMKKYPDATYDIYKDEQHRPYVYDPNLGYMVYTTVTISGETHEMWLPVMDNNNKAMKAEPYTYKDRWNKEHTVNAATMFDINTALMRCLTKTLAMFGLALYIYAGEDLPEDEQPVSTADGNASTVTPKVVKTEQQASTTPEQKDSDDPLKRARHAITLYCNKQGLDLAQTWEEFSITRDMPAEILEAKLELIKQTYGK